jgi:hypothetical protein
VKGVGIGEAAMQELPSFREVGVVHDELLNLEVEEVGDGFEVGLEQMQVLQLVQDASQVEELQHEVAARLIAVADVLSDGLIKFNDFRFECV